MSVAIPPTTTCSGRRCAPPLMLSVSHASAELDEYVQRTYIVNMSGIEFEWDEGKNQENIRKHGIASRRPRPCFRMSMLS